MSRFPFFEKVDVVEAAKCLKLASHTPEIVLEGLSTGVDNLRSDVFLSPKFTEKTQAYILRLLARHGDVESLIEEDELRYFAPRSISILSRNPLPSPQTPPKTSDSGVEFRRNLTELQIVALNQAKSQGNISIDLLARVAIVKMFRIELLAQFGHVVERCRARLKRYEGPRANPKGVELRERFAKLQISKKIVLRKAGQEVFATLREVEKESVSRMRRSLFGDLQSAAYELFLNRLLFTEEGRDDYLTAEHYVMLGNFDRDPDRFQLLLEAARAFLRQLEIVPGTEIDGLITAWLNAAENAQELVGCGVPEDGTPRGKAQRALLDAWTERLEKAGIMDHVIASYEVVPLLAEYSPLINPQQLKSALISKVERKRVEQLLEEHGKISQERLQATVKKMGSHGAEERAKFAGRFLMDFMRYHRDVNRLQVLNSAADGVNLLLNEKLRELSSINNTLYEFLLPEEQRPAEDKVIHHVILKADIRDSTTLTRTLFERGLNPASYFSLNFYEPVNKLLTKYGAAKVFIEGDAVILAILEREGEPNFGVARTCMLAREVIEIVRGYNEHSQKGGLPVLELGIGICFQNSPPMYLMDGNTRIMISKALNESDRLSSCSKGGRRYLQGLAGLFNVFAFQSVDDKDTGGTPDEFLLRYNIGGIQISAEAFGKLQQEISLELHEIALPVLWGEEQVRLYSGLVPVGAASFHKILVREAFVPRIDARDFSLTEWTQRKYYEVCTSEALNQLIRHSRGAAASSP